jgi:hypothetical protein
MVKIRFLRAILLLVLLIVFPGQSPAQENLRIPIKDAGLFDPEKGLLAIPYELQKEAEEVVVRIRDFRGQVVRQERLIAYLAGDHIFTWDGRDANGDRLPEGGYEVVFEVRFRDGSTGGGLVAARIAQIAPVPGAPAPQLLPPEAHRFAISGTLSSIWRHDGENREDTGQVRARTRFSYADDTRRAEGVAAVIDTYPGGDTNWDASQAFVEQHWPDGRIRGVLREGLGAFDDPVKLFSDFKSERRKFGLRVDQGLGRLKATGLAFATEGDVDTEAAGTAARLRFGEEDGWQLGCGFTHREARPAAGRHDRFHNQALAADLRAPVFGSLTLLGEFIHTEDTTKASDNGYTALAAWDRSRLRLSAGYIDLGEDFAADFSNPLHGITGDARGIEANVDYASPTSWRYFRSPIFTARIFDLKRHSDHKSLREIDTSLRFAAGEGDRFFFNWYTQEKENGLSHTFLGTVTHRWDSWWSSRLQVNRVDAEDSGTWRFTLDGTYRREARKARMALEYIRRSIDAARLSPYEETSLRLDWDNQRWGVQLQGRYSQNEDDHGINVFGRVEYRRELLHRYQWIVYAALGSRSAFDFEKQVEAGVALRF